MKIGVFFTTSKNQGGVYQYSLAILEALSQVKNNQYVIFTTSSDIPISFYKKSNFEVIKINSPSRNIVDRVRNSISLLAGVIFPKLIPFLYRHGLFWLISIPDRLGSLGYIKLIESKDLDFIIYPTSSNLSFLANIPSAVAIHDLAHRLYPHFPEVSAGGRWELREYSFRQMVKHAKYILVDSQIGKEDVLNCYPDTDPNKIVMLNFLPPSYLHPNIKKTQINQVIKKYKLPKQYFYYPAKFWPHKHHLTLIEALKICHSKGYNFGLALTGSKNAEFSTFNKVMNLANQYGLSEYVRYLGYVSDVEISALYKGAIALTMPTNFGPTNIPVLEAWKLKCPVIYSNVRGCKEQLGNAGITANPDDADAWAKAMIKMATDKKFVVKCIASGESKLNLWQRHDFYHTVRQLF